MKIFEQIEEMCKTGQLTEAQALKAVVFFEDLVENGELVKEASIPLDLGKRFIQGIAIGGGIAGANILANKAITGSYEKKLDAATQAGYERMLNVSPSLQNENQDDVRNNYATLMKFAPSLAMDPYAAAGYIRRVLQFDPESGADYNVLRTVVQLEKDHQDARAKSVNNITSPIGGIASNISGKIIPD